jgi:ribosome-associated protein
MRAIGRRVPSTHRALVQTQPFILSGDTIALCDLLKCAGLATSSGQGKHLVAQGGVQVDGLPESRKTAKIRAGQVVEFQGARVLVRAPEPPAADDAPQAD